MVKVRSIPRFYTNRVDAKDVSRDIAASMAQFVHMANLFEEKSKTVGLVESMMSIHEQRLTMPRDSKTGLQSSIKWQTWHVVFRTTL